MAKTAGKLWELLWADCLVIMPMLNCMLLLWMFSSILIFFFCTTFAPSYPDAWSLVANTAHFFEFYLVVAAVSCANWPYCRFNRTVPLIERFAQSLTCFRPNQKYAEGRFHYVFRTFFQCKPGVHQNCTNFIWPDHPAEGSKWRDNYTHLTSWPKFSEPLC